MAYEAWLDSLTSVEREVAQCALRAHDVIVEGLGLTAGCYYLAFFRQYLRLEKNVDVTAVVGWVNDGTSPLHMSHAWLEFRNKKTDISLTRTEFPDVQSPGPMIVLDRALRRGKATYTYHRSRSGLALMEMRGIEQCLIDKFECEHDLMKAVSGDDAEISAYLEAAPRELSYRAVARQMSDA